VGKCQELDRCRRLAADVRSDSWIERTIVSYAQLPDTPVSGTILAMTGASVDQCDLPDREIMIARIAALAATGAPALSYALNTGAAVEAGLTVEEAQGVLVAVAPIIGTARTVAATEELAEGVRLGLASMEEDIDGEG
jgi:hypothetical protein